MWFVNHVWQSGLFIEPLRTLAYSYINLTHLHLVKIRKKLTDLYLMYRIIYFQKLNEEECLPKEQNQLGEIYKQGDFLTFSVQTFEPDNLVMLLYISNLEEYLIKSACVHPCDVIITFKDTGFTSHCCQYSGVFTMKLQDFL